MLLFQLVSEFQGQLIFNHNFSSLKLLLKKFQENLIKHFAKSTKY